MLHVLRGLFIGACMFLGAIISTEAYRATWWEGLLIGAGVSLCAVLLEWAYAHRFIAVISIVMFGLLAGFVVSWIVIGFIDLIPALKPDEGSGASTWRNVGIVFVFCFLSVLAVLHARDDFKFVIPFVEFKREGKSLKPLILDTSAIIDGRIADVLASRIVDSPVILPRFVLVELQQVADSSDKLKRGRGRRGLDILQRMRQTPGFQIDVRDVLLPEIEGVDAKLVQLARLIDGRLVTTDFNLSKVAQVQGVEVVNLNDLANSLRPPVLQGERVTIRVARRGDSPGQGVGYLEDGTMVVAEGCAEKIGQEVPLVVTNVLQTSAGRLVFGRPQDDGPPTRGSADPQMSKSADHRIS